MNKFDCALIVTHVAFREREKEIPSDGPFSTVVETILTKIRMVDVLEIPLIGYVGRVLYGNAKKEKGLYLPKILGYITPVKYAIDFILVGSYCLIWNYANRSRKRLIIGVDPLSTLPIAILSRLLNFTLIYYSVDFNRKRFSNRVLQYLYQKADEISTKSSNQTWNVCDSLIDYKFRNYGLQSLYIPNSVAYNKNIFLKNRKYKNKHRLVWVGTLMTERQGEMLFSVIKHIQTINPNISIVLAPTRNFTKFKYYVNKFSLRKCKILKVSGREACLQLVAKCDVGIAVYDNRCGSTEFIEPMKIWDYMLGGLPFIISSEPSISRPIRRSGVAFFLDPDNQIPSGNNLKKFLSPDNLTRLRPKCLKLAEKYDARSVIIKAVNKL